MQLNLGSSQSREGPNVDAEIEDHVNTLNGNGWIHKDLLSTAGGLDIWLDVAVLFGDHWRDITFDPASSKANQDHGGDELKSH